MWAIAVRTWDCRYDEDARAVAAFAVSRVEAALRTGRLDCEVRYGRTALSADWKTNPQREHAVKRGGYPALRALLVRCPSSDSIPLVVASLAGSPTRSLWDGHRRLETYRAAGRIDVPAWHAVFSPGSGVVSVATPTGTETRTGAP